MTPPRFQLRVASEADIPALRLLIERSVRGLQGNHYTPAQIEGALGHALGLDTQLVSDRTYFVAYPEGQPATLAGCGGWSFRRTLFGSDGGPHRLADCMDPAIEAAKIRAIFVDPEYARMGLGSHILQHAEDAARQHGFCRTEMGSTLTGLPLYRLKGYVEEKHLAVSLPNGQTMGIVRMTKQL
jgi:GNAT superfamily N-acetyltransferase